MNNNYLTENVRENVFDRDNNICQYCGRYIAYDFRAWQGQVVLQVDHITPLRLGGTHDFENLCTCCSDCNNLKKHFPLDDYLRALLKANAEYLDQREQHFIDDDGFPVIIRPKGLRGLRGYLHYADLPH